MLSFLYLGSPETAMAAVSVLHIVLLRIKKWSYIGGCGNTAAQRHSSVHSTHACKYRSVSSSVIHLLIVPTTISHGRIIAVLRILASFRMPTGIAQHQPFSAYRAESLISKGLYIPTHFDLSFAIRAVFCHDIRTAFHVFPSSPSSSFLFFLARAVSKNGAISKPFFVL